MYFRVSEPTYPTLPPIPTYCTNTGISLENAGLRRITAGWPALTRLRVPQPAPRPRRRRWWSAVLPQPPRHAAHRVRVRLLCLRDQPALAAGGRAIRRRRLKRVYFIRVVPHPNYTEQCLSDCTARGQACARRARSPPAIALTSARRCSPSAASTLKRMPPSTPSTSPRSTCWPRMRGGSSRTLRFSQGSVAL